MCVIQSDKYVLSLPKFDTIFNFRCVAFGHSTIYFEMIFFLVSHSKIWWSKFRLSSICSDSKRRSKSFACYSTDCILRNRRRMNDSDFSIIIKLFILHNTRAEEGGAKCPNFFSPYTDQLEMLLTSSISQRITFLLLRRKEKKKPLCGCIRCSIYQSNKMYNLSASNSNVYRL